MISLILLRIGRRIDLDAVVDRRQLAQQRLGDLAVGRDDDLAGLAVDHVERDLLAQQDVAQRLGQLLAQLARVFFLYSSSTCLRLLPPLARRQLASASTSLLGRDLHIHDDAVGAGRNLQRGVLHVRGLLAEDGAQQALFRRQFGFALGRDLADQDVAGLHFRADADDAVAARGSSALPRPGSECRA